MPFRPIHESHAISEVIFGLVLARPLEWGERKRLHSAHSKWSAFLPKIRDESRLAIAVLPADPSEAPPPPSPPPLAFERYNPSGMLDWRLQMEGANIAVNCLAYSLWNNVWPSARRLFTDIADVLQDSSIHIRSLILEYVDIFEQTDDSTAYDIESLIDKACPHLPRTALQHGPLWHTHHGWFTNDDSPDGTRILKRMHINGLNAPEDKNKSIVRMEMLARLDFLKEDDRPHMPSQLFKDRLEEHFVLLHQQSKNLLALYLTEDMSAQISLNAS